MIAHDCFTYSKVYPNKSESGLVSICCKAYDKAPKFVPALNPMNTGASVHSHTTVMVVDDVTVKKYVSSDVRSTLERFHDILKLSKIA